MHYSIIFHPPPKYTQYQDVVILLKWILTLVVQGEEAGGGWVSRNITDCDSVEGR